MFETLFAKGGLTLERLRTLAEVQQAGSIAAAAQFDHNTQSKFSHQIRDLSEYFGCELTEREGKVVKLTDQAKRLVELTRGFFGELEDFYSECANKRRTFTIAAGDSIIQWLLIPRLRDLLAKIRNIGIATCNSRTHNIVQQLTDARADFGILRSDAVNDPLRSHPLGTLRYVAVVPTKLLGSRGLPGIKVLLRDYPMAAQTTDGVFAGKMRDIAARLGVFFQLALGCQSFPHTVAAVRSGAFAAVVPELAVTELDSRSVELLDLKELRSLDRPLSLAWTDRMIEVRSQGAALLDELKRALRIG